MPIYKLSKRKFRACNINCPDGFREDRRLLLIYGPFNCVLAGHPDSEGGFYRDAESWSMAEGQCVYCNAPITDKAKKRFSQEPENAAA